MTANTGAILERQRAFFSSGKTREHAFRVEQLRKLRDAIRSREDPVMEALKEDLGKPPFESYAGEIGILYLEIAHTLRHLNEWMKTRSVPTPILHFPSTSAIHWQPYGAALIIGPWNYPFQLILAPLVGAIAAGNCAVLKPSELAPRTSSTVAALVAETFPDDYIAAVEGGVEETREILRERFDTIFFTGGTAVGRIVMEAAAKHLTPVTLELGGKSPTIVDRDARLDCAARRIAWGKFFNAGQTCLAPDYLLVHRDVREPFLEEMTKTLRAFYGDDPRRSPDYARIINDRHFRRIAALMEEGRILHGGETDPGERYIAPTLIGNVTLEDLIMREEIFGPLLPVLSFTELDEAIDLVNRLPRPLALYLFSESAGRQERVLARTSSGGGCINDTISHVGSQELPFGGIGDSGMGAYHGRYSFEAFSQARGILKRSTRIDMPLRYPPYRGRISLLKRLFRILG